MKVYTPRETIHFDTLIHRGGWKPAEITKKAPAEVAGAEGFQ
jgi:hypothetical protein